MSDIQNNNFSFAEVILPLSVAGTFTYSIPEQLQGKLQIGQRIVVPFGGKKLYTGILYSFHNQKPELYKTKAIIDALEDFSMVNPEQLKLWNWIAQYYLNTIGEVYRNAFPTALKLESETFIKKNEDREIDWSVLDEFETLILQSLENKSLISLKELEAFIPADKIISVVRTLFEERWIDLDEKLKEKYKPKLADFIRIQPNIEKNPILFQQTLDNLQKAGKQREIFLQLIQTQTQKPKVKKADFLKEFGFSSSILKALIDKELVQNYTLQQDRIAHYSEEKEAIFDLTPAQKTAYLEIQNHWKTNDVCLLHGITSSGKTEIYIQLIQEQLKQQKNSLFLLPEIAITTQLIQRLQLKFGNDVAVYHSKLNTQERVEIYQKVLQNKLKIIVGARSALFLPFPHLGLVIIDEEHETSYKQETRPYYNAKESAIVLAKIYQAKVILGSATPSLESLHNAETGKYKKVNLTERFGEVLPPKIELIPLQEELPYEGAISNTLESKIKAVLAEKKQVILFQNRRGYTPIMECEQCSYAPDCPNCDVTLTYHKSTHNLKCHYCNYTLTIPKNCPNCQSFNFSYKGLGTQKIEEEVLLKFPENKIFRMDSDTMRGKYAYEKLFERFEANEIEILIGTQMITKGLDFGNVGLVAVIKADSMLHIPDFRIEEKTYQTLIQVAGRAGRRKEQGQVVFQTYDPNHHVFEAIISEQEKAFNQYLLTERKQYNYPPYCKLIEIEFTHTSQEKTEKLAHYFTHSLFAFIPKEYILGPTAPSIARVKNKYIFKTLLKIPLEVSQTGIKQKLTESLENIKQLQGLKSVRVKIMVDPV